MRVLYAVELGNNDDTYRYLIDANYDIERIYYKLALIEQLEGENNTIILSQSLEEDLELKDIINIFKIANPNSILIISEKYRDSSLLVELLNNGIYNGIFKDDVDSNYIINLLNNERDIEEAKDYYALLSDPIVNKEDIKEGKNIKFNLFRILKR